MEITNLQLDDFLNAVFCRYGYDFRNYSKASLKRRISRIVEKHSVRDFFDLRHLIINNEDFFSRFLQEVTVNVTEMFRDPTFYRLLTKTVFPQLATYPTIKIWHAGCSTGEEVYSMAILLREAGLLERALLYATDLNPAALAKARQGMFPMRNIKEYTQNYIKAGGICNFSDYYTANYDYALFDYTLKKNMIFSMHNLVSDQSFNEFNLILCRNVLIYFDKDLQDRVLNLFTRSLCMFGYLGLGSKESIMFTGQKSFYAVVDSQEKLYKKIAESK
jgi:chemotaxis protein methyltransferase CheR